MMAPHQLSKLWALATLLCAAAAGSSWVVSAAEVTQICTAKWVLLTTHWNGLGQQVNHEFSYQVGPLSTGGHWRPPWEKRPKELVSMAARLQPRDWHASSTGVVMETGSQSHSQHVISTEVQLSHEQLKQARTMPGQVTVPAKSSVTVWQLVAESEDTRAGFGNTAVTSGFEEPPAVTSCTARYRVRARVGNSWVRLRHKRTGQYMTMTIRKGWDAATLGYSRQFRFRLVKIHGSVYRIKAQTCSFHGYRYAYSSVGGGIYFDEYDGYQEKQQWTLSIPDPLDGDVVTFRNVNWPTAYMTYYDGSETNIFCEYTHSPDQWVIELAE